MLDSGRLFVQVLIIFALSPNKLEVISDDKSQFSAVNIFNVILFLRSEYSGDGVYCHSFGIFPIVFSGESDESLMLCEINRTRDLTSS
jgi:hypothetical protein